MRSDFASWAKEPLAFGVGADGGCGAVEVCGFGVGAEDVGEEEVAYAALCSSQLGLVKLSTEEAYCHDNAD